MALRPLTFLSAPARKPLVFLDQLETRGNVTKLPPAPRTGAMLINIKKAAAEILPGPNADLSGSSVGPIRVTRTPYTLDGAISIKVLPANPNRRYVLIQNLDAANTVNFDFDQPATIESYQIPFGGNYEPDAAAMPTNEIYVFASVAGTKILVAEG